MALAGLLGSDKATQACTALFLEPGLFRLP